uniref:Large ribosomal subunit protein uL22c n=1 Tax=Olisthodiscus luteus TaxID=83000 RepID=A0A7U0QG36_OLILU|nr:chloroplast 50S ribosomal protein L22 [Olisthodiscus luteus]QQW50591.1 chloroplast 50S ribosomal protein L22 [Olisthodiscus luteus]
MNITQAKVYATSKAKYIRTSQSKVKRILKQLHNRSYQEALMILEFMPYRACLPIFVALQSAAANAKQNYNLEKQDLVIHEAFVTKGPYLKRFRPRAQGRAYKIYKPTCHITISVSSIKVN